jgi:ADP-ribosylglycohydrolase
VAAERGSLGDSDAHDAVAERFIEWYRSRPGDIGNHTREVLGRGAQGEHLPDIARDLAERFPQRSGNGSLMRTGPVALPHLGDTAAIIAAATGLSSLTHATSAAVEACVLWSLAIDHAVRTGELVGPAIGLSSLEPRSAEQWRTLLREAEQQDPETFARNGWVVRTLQAAWSAIYHTRHEEDHLVAALRRCVAIGDDTDTVAAVAGSLLGARYGVSAIPFDWRHGLFGWPYTHRDMDLVHLAVLAARGRDAAGWPGPGSMLDYYGSFQPAGFATSLKVDPGVVFGDIARLPTAQADDVLSLCRIGDGDRHGPTHDVVWLSDDDQNVACDRVLADTADAIAQLRRQGRTVFVHCVRAESRTPSVAMAWLRRHHGRTYDEALAEVLAAMPTANPHPALLAAVATCHRHPEHR